MAIETTVTIIGNLTADPELRHTQNGLAVANFTIAHTPRKWDRQVNDFVDGEALFLRGSIWREYAENVANSLHKGDRVIAQGVLKQRSYETKEGERRQTIELEVESIGPDLRYATAVITRKGGGQRDGSEPAPGWGGSSQEPAYSDAAPASNWGTPRTPGGSTGEGLPF